MRVLALLLVIAASPVLHAESPRTALVIHGGAGTISRETLDPAREADIRDDLERALAAGDAVLSTGGTALDAVVAAVLVLEDSPHFNAGRGAVFNADGGHELDAAIMDGSTLDAGAVAGVRNLRNPVLLARAVMEDSPHVMLVGEGAERFAATLDGIEFAEPTYFHTEQRWRQLQEARRRETAGAAPARMDAYGTVGAVALDRDGRIAAATSTGGMTNKRFGRVGDAPIIGAGTYASAGCGVSATGWGEYFIRLAVAHDICARVAYGGASLAEAAHAVVMERVPGLGGDGGVIALDADGEVHLVFNTPGMYRGWIRTDGSRGVAIHGED